MEFATRALRAWAVPYVVPVLTAVRVFDPDGRVRDEAIEAQLQTLGQEVVRVAKRFAATAQSTARPCVTRPLSASPPRPDSLESSLLKVVPLGGE